uniref:Uncharacterized protein n=1 Tax=Vespula pensylvanica TaxID=30213 RepID=A0A834PDJ4_VESPE|nr:hypothetical protein H0235_000055 [Vespula pensylvanica]
MEIDESWLFEIEGEDRIPYRDDTRQPRSPSRTEKRDGLADKVARSVSHTESEKVLVRRRKRLCFYSATTTYSEGAGGKSADALRTEESANEFSVSESGGTTTFEVDAPFSVGVKTRARPIPQAASPPTGTVPTNAGLCRGSTAANDIPLNWPHSSFVAAPRNECTKIDFTTRDGRGPRRRRRSRSRSRSRRSIFFLRPTVLASTEIGEDPGRKSTIDEPVDKCRDAARLNSPIISNGIRIFTFVEIGRSNLWFSIYPGTSLNKNAVCAGTNTLPATVRPVISPWEYLLATPS